MPLAGLRSRPKNSGVICQAAAQAYPLRRLGPARPRPLVSGEGVPEAPGQAPIGHFKIASDAPTLSGFARCEWCHGEPRDRSRLEPHMLFGQGDDRPLSCDWTADPGILERIGMVTPNRRGQAQAKASIVACLVTEKLGAGRRVAYSRDNDFYAEARDAPRYNGMAYSRDLVCGFIDGLESVGLVINAKSPPQPPRAGEDETKRMQSACWATDKLMALVHANDVRHRRPGVPVVMRREDKSLVDLPDTDWARRMIRETESLNEWLERIDVTVGLDADPADWDVGPFHMKARKVRKSGKITWSTVVPTDPHVVRILSREHRDKGGRLYGWWQNLPKARRGELLINGELLVEPDFTALHPTLLYAMQGLILREGEFDPYTPDLRRWTRKAGKLALNVAINAKSIPSAVQALLDKRKQEGDDGTPKWKYGPRQTRALVDAIIEHNRPIARYICSDMGVSLMGIDSRMCVEVLKRCRRDGVATLPVHDSFMTGQSNEAVVTGHMAEVMDQTRTKLFSGVTRVYGLNVLTNAIPSPSLDTSAPVVVPVPVLDTPALEGIPCPGEDTPALTGIPRPGSNTPTLGLPCALGDTSALEGISGLEISASSRSASPPSEPRSSSWKGRVHAVLPSSDRRSSSPVLPALAVPWALGVRSPEPLTPATLNLVLRPSEPILMTSTTWHDPDPLPCTMTLNGEVMKVAGGLRRHYADAELAAGRDPWEHLPPEARPVGEWPVVTRAFGGYIQGSSC